MAEYLTACLAVLMVVQRVAVMANYWVALMVLLKAMMRVVATGSRLTTWLCR